MARLKGIAITGFRSIDDEIDVRFPEHGGVLIVGENNAGKSNIVRALDLVLGERWPGSFSPEDHDYFGREPRAPGAGIRVTVDVEDVVDERWGAISSLSLSCSDDARTEFTMDTESAPSRFVSNAVRNQLTCMVVGADRRLSYQLSYASQWTLLSKLMRRFHHVLMDDEARVERLRDYFALLHDVFDEVDEFAEFRMQLATQVEELSQNLTYGLDIDFSAYDPSNYFRAMRVHPMLDGQTRSFDELGTGQEQILALGFAYSYAHAFAGDNMDLVLVVEEPEAHLHPLAQDWLATRLSRFLDADVQVLITTHSPSFIDLQRLDGLVVARKAEDSSATYTLQRSPAELAAHCHDTGASPGLSAESILSHYDAHATAEIRAAFFARAVLLVEGLTEALALPILLARLGVETARLGIAVVSVTGKGNLAKWWRLFTCYETPTLIMFDNDVKNDPDAARRTDVLDTVGIPQEDHEALLTAETLVVRDSVVVFGNDYESTLRGLLPDYEAVEQTAENVVGTSKPLKARYVADHLPLEDRPPELELFAAAVLRLVEPGPT